MSEGSLKPVQSGCKGIYRVSLIEPVPESAVGGLGLSLHAISNRRNVIITEYNCIIIE
jgi:hypothetical protein